jgi:cation:H+ antiporter
MILAIALLIAGLALILLAAEFFTNGVEHLGEKLNLGEGAVGSVLAAVGTAMPETLVPIVAILFSKGTSNHEIGLGGIKGLPFRFCFPG